MSGTVLRPHLVVGFVAVDDERHTPVPVHESFHNVYAERTGNMRVSRRAADRNADADRLAVLHIRLWAYNTVTADVEQVTT